MISRAKPYAFMRAACPYAILCLILAQFLPGGLQGLPAAAGTLPAPSVAEAEPVPPPVARLIELVEAELGRPLPPGDWTRCLDAGKRVMAALREREMMFLHAVADILRLEPGQVALMAEVEAEEDAEAFDRDMRPKLEQVLGRRITGLELQRIHAIDEDRLRALEPMREAFAREIAEATGLSADSAAVLLPLAGM